MVFRMHPTPGCWGEDLHWLGTTGLTVPQTCRVVLAGVRVSFPQPPRLPSPGCLWTLSAPGASEKQAPKHPKNGFSTLMPFKWIRNLLPGLQPLQALVRHSSFFAGLLLKGKAMLIKPCKGHFLRRL